MADMDRKGRASRSAMKLTAEDVRWMRWARAYAGVTYKALGDAFGVSRAAAHLVCSGKIWRHVPLTREPGARSVVAMDRRATIAADVRALIQRLGGIGAASRALRMPRDTVTSIGSEWAMEGSFELAASRLEALRATEDADTDKHARPA
jgi:hypothetical protein